MCDECSKEMFCEKCYLEDQGRAARIWALYYESKRAVTTIDNSPETTYEPQK